MLYKFIHVPPPLRGPQGKTFEDLSHALQMFFDVPFESLRGRHSRASGDEPSRASAMLYNIFRRVSLVHVPPSSASGSDLRGPQEATFESLRGQHSRASAMLYNIFRRVSLSTFPSRASGSEIRGSQPCSTIFFDE
jgi:hypothetical protein